MEGPQVRENASQPVYQNAGQFTAGVRAVGQLGGALENTAQAFDQIATREAQRQAYDVEVTVGREYQARMLDAQKNRQGEKAKGLAQETNDWLEQTKATYLEKLSPYARQLAGKSLGRIRDQAIESSTRFENQQLDVALDQSWAASKQTTISSALSNPAPEAVAAAAEQLRQRNTEQAVRRGWSPEVLAAETLKDTTALHTGVLDRLLASDTVGAAGAAKAYYLKHQGEINGAVHDDIDKRLAQAGKAEVVQKNAIEIAGKFNYTQSEAALAAIDALGAPADVKTAIRQDVLQRHSIQLADSQQRHAKATKELYSAVAAGANLQQLQKTPQWRELNDGGLALITMMEQRAAVRESRLAAQEGRAAAAESRAETRILRAERQQERATVAAAMRYSDPDVLQSMTRPQIEALLPVLGENHTTRLLARKDSFTKSPEKLIEARVDDNAFNFFAAQAGLRPNEPRKTEEEKDRLNSARLRIETAIDRAQAAKKAPLSREEKDKIMRDEIGRTVVTDKGFFSSSKEVPAIALSPNDLKNVQIPDAQRNTLAEKMKADGVAPTEDNLRMYYIYQVSPTAAKTIYGR